MSSRLGGTVGLLLLAIGLAATTARAQVISLVKDLSGEALGVTAIDDAGSVVYAVASSNQYGTNPDHRLQIFRWNPVTGAGEQVTNFDGGVLSVSVSDDGQWLAFISSGDLTGANHDESPEIFVMRSDGSDLAQITNDTSLAGDGVLTAVIAGSGNRVVFTADTDPLGTNPGRTGDVFVVDRDGTNVVQFSQAYYYSRAAISDDGNRIAFIESDGPPNWTTHIQTSPADGSSPPVTIANGSIQINAIALSGNGATIIFGDYGTISKVNWDGTGLVSPLASGYGPSIVDDGLTVFYRSSNGDIRKIGSDGSGDTLVATATSPLRYSSPLVSGDGTRIAVLSLAGTVPGGTNPDGGVELAAMDGSGGNIRQLTLMSVNPVNSMNVRILSNGTRIFLMSNSDPLGANPDHSWQVFTILSGGTGLAQLTHTTTSPLGNGVRSYSVSDAGVVVFETESNLTGLNACGTIQLYKINASGTGLTQVSNNCNGTTYTRFPVVRFDGQWILFIGYVNNVFGLYQMTINGTSVAIVAPSYGNELFDYSMSTIPVTWIAYSSPANSDGLNPNHLHQISRITLTGGFYHRLTADPVYSSDLPDISGDSNKIVWQSQADFVGLNPDHSQEIFLYDVPTGSTRQLTNTTGGFAGFPRITRDGAWVYYNVEDDSVRMSLATGEVQRVTGFPPGHARYLDVDSTGARTLIGGQDVIDKSPGGVSLFLADQNVRPKFSVGKAAPTLLSWDPDPQSVRYDVLRGDVANLSFVASTVNLGAVTCVEDDSPDNHTQGYEDALQPLPGQVFFYLYRGTTGYPPVTGSWGQGTGATERVAGAGSCNP